MKKRILFVDDEPNVLNGLSRMLLDQREKWEMCFAYSVDEALDQLHNSDFDVIVTDIRMPGKDGFAFLKILRETEKTKDIPVIVLTGCNESDLKRRALDLGAMDLLNKPIEREDLLARLRNMLQLKAHQDMLKNQNEILERKVRERTIELEGSRLDIIWHLGKVAEFRDEETGNHVVRVGRYCHTIAESLGMEKDFIETIFLTGPLHDIGKIGIPDGILLKPGKLNPDEWKIMKKHCEIGAKIFHEDSKAMRSFLVWSENHLLRGYNNIKNRLSKMAATIALTHHEKWDGTGYPQGLAGEDIPLESRIAAISDVYDALCSKRPYKPAYPESEATKIISGEVGRHFDPRIYNAFEKSLEEFRGIRAQFKDEITEGMF